MVPRCHSGGAVTSHAPLYGLWRGVVVGDGVAGTGVPVAGSGPEGSFSS